MKINDKLLFVNKMEWKKLNNSDYNIDTSCYYVKTKEKVLVFRDSKRLNKDENIRTYYIESINLPELKVEVLFKENSGPSYRLSNVSY